MPTELTELKAGLEAAFASLAQQQNLGDSRVRVSEAQLDILAHEVSRYMPELAKMLAEGGRKTLAAMSKLVRDERPLGARAMIGFAVQGGRAPRDTAAWMKELREGDED